MRKKLLLIVIDLYILDGFFSGGYFKRISIRILSYVGQNSIHFFRKYTTRTGGLSLPSYPPHYMEPWRSLTIADAILHDLQRAIRL